MLGGRVPARSTTMPSYDRARRYTPAGSMKPQVYKFGGVAVGGADAIRRAVAHVRRAAPNLAVVVSAMNGVTDLLLDAGQAALRGDRARCEAAVAEFESRHLDLIGELIGSRDAAERLRQSLA